jgi:hypothetical protein
MEHTVSLNWRKSSYSGNNGGNCVEVADHDGRVLVRDTKNDGRGPVHRFTTGQWDALVAEVRKSESA